MANGKTKQNKTKQNNRNVEILWPKKTWRKFVGGLTLYGTEKKKQKIAGSMPGQPRRFLPTMTQHNKERCKYVGSTEVRSPVLLVVN